jgi:Transposase DDE domain
MAARTKIDERAAKPKYRYRVTNWAEYDRALVNRGNLTLWFDERHIAESWTPPRPVGRGKPGSYSDVAIQTCLTLKTLFRLPYRATEGLLKSLMRLCALNLPVPDHTHMSRRAAALEVKIPRRPRKGGTHVVVDSTGLKIFGEGEWKVRQHGVGKRRTWRKIHLAVDETEKDIIGIEVTTPTCWRKSTVRLPRSLPMEPTTPKGRTPPLPSGTPRRRSHRVTGRWPGVMTIRGMPSWRKLQPRVGRDGRKIPATTGAASPKT